MRKHILILTIALIATPAFGALDVALVRNGANVDIVYTGNGTTPATRVRSFALDLLFQTGATFTGVTGYKQGESTFVSRGYGIYPAKIQIDSAAGTVNNFGTPDACSTDPGMGTGSGFGTNHIVLEFASLYYGEVNAPAASGTLCSLTVNPGAVSNPCITMVDELTYRGGVIYEDGTQDLTAADKMSCYGCLSVPGMATNPNPANGAINVNRSTTILSWTAGIGACGIPATFHDVYFGTVNPPVTKVINSGTDTTYNPGTMVGKKTYYWRVDEKDSAGTTTGNVWNFTTACKCDLNGSGTVTSSDITILANYWINHKNALGMAAMYLSGWVNGMDVTGDARITSSDITNCVNLWINTKNGLGVAPCGP